MGMNLKSFFDLNEVEFTEEELLAPYEVQCAKKVDFKLIANFTSFKDKLPYGDENKRIKYSDDIKEKKESFFQYDNQFMEAS